MVNKDFQFMWKKVMGTPGNLMTYSGQFLLNFFCTSCAALLKAVVCKISISAIQLFLYIENYCENFCKFLIISAKDRETHNTFIGL